MPKGAFELKWYRNDDGMWCVETPTGVFCPHDVWEDPFPSLIEAARRFWEAALWGDCDFGEVLSGKPLAFAESLGQAKPDDDGGESDNSE